MSVRLATITTGPRRQWKQTRLQQTNVCHLFPNSFIRLLSSSCGMIHLNENSLRNVGIFSASYISETLLMFVSTFQNLVKLFAFPFYFSKRKGFDAKYLFL